MRRTAVKRSGIPARATTKARRHGQHRISQEGRKCHVTLGQKKLRQAYSLLLLR